MTSERKEDYLKAIDQIVCKKGYAQVKDISKELGIGPSSVTGMLKKLTDDGCINYEKYGGVTLTPLGKEIANETREKFSAIRDFLMYFGIDEKAASEDACKMEHIITPETYDKIMKLFIFSVTEEGNAFRKDFKEFCDAEDAKHKW